MASKTYNYLVTIDLDSGSPKRYALLRVQCPAGWSGLGLSGVYESRLLEEPSISHDVGDPWGGIVNSSQVTLRFYDPAGEFTTYFGSLDLRTQDVMIHEYEYGSTDTPRSLFAGTIKSCSAACDADGTIVVSIAFEAYKSGLLETVVPKISYTNDGQWEATEKYRVADEFGARFPAIISGTREHVPCVLVQANPTLPSYKYVIAHDIAGEQICQQYHPIQVPNGTWIGLGCQTTLRNLYRLSSDDNKLRVMDLGIINGNVSIARESKSYDGLTVELLTATADRNQRARVYADIEACELDIDNLSTVVAAWRFANDYTSDDPDPQPYKLRVRKSASLNKQNQYSFTKANNVYGRWDDQGGDINITFQEITGCDSWPACEANFVAGRNGTADSAIVVYKNTPLLTDDTHRAYQFDQASGLENVFGTSDFYCEAQVRMTDDVTLSNGLKIPAGLDGCLFAQPYTADSGHGGMYFYVTSTGLSANVAFVNPVSPSVGRQIGWVSGDYNFEQGKWYVVGLEIERQSTQAILRLYVDNVTIGTGVVTSVPAAWSLSNQEINDAPVKWRLFNDNAYDVGHTGFQGIVDYIRLYLNTKGAELDFAGGMTGQSISAVKMEAGYDLIVDDGSNVDLNGTGRNDMGLGTGDSMAIMFWFKHSPIGTLDRYISSYGTYTSDGWRILLGGSNNGAKGAICFAINSGSFYRFGGGFDDNKWHQVWIIANNTSNTVTIRVDNAEGSNAASFSLVSAGQQFLISTQTANNSFEGHIDEFVIIKAAIGSLPDRLYRTTQYFTAKGNPAMVLARVLGGIPWGLGSTTDNKYQVIDYDPLNTYQTGTHYPNLTNSFGLVAAELDSYDLSLNGALFNEKQASNVINEICSIYGITVWFDGWKWMCGLIWSSETTHLMGWLDKQRNNVDSLTYERAVSDSIPQSVIVRFGRVTDMERSVDKAYLFETEKKSVPNGTGDEKRYLDFDLIRKPDVADRVCAYYAGWWSADRVVNADVQKTKFEDIAVGDMAQLEATQVGIGSSFGNDDFRVFSVQRSPDFGMKVKLYADAKTTAIDGYTPGTLTSVADQDLQADYRFTSPDPPTDFYCVGVQYWEFGAICAFAFTAPSGQIAEEALANITLQWQERPNGSDASINDFNWHFEVLSVKPGSTYIWTTRAFIPTHTYALQVYALTYYGKDSPRAMVIEAGATSKTDPTYGTPGRRDLVITPPADAAVTNGAYVWEQGGLGSGSATYKITPSPAFDSVTTSFTSFFPVEVDVATAGREPVIILDNAWYNWVASAPGVFEFTTGGTGNVDVTFGRAPDTGAVAYAIVKTA